MKRNLITLTAVLLLNIYNSSGQTIVFSENFDSVISMSSTGSPGFQADSAYFLSAPKSIRGQYAASGETALTSPSFSTAGNNFVVLSFDHICKTSFFDTCIVEVSTDNGITWTALLPGNSIYMGSSPVFPSTGNFSSGCYSLWDFANAGTLNNAWWQQEQFDVSALCSNQADVRLRFRSKDNGDGMAGYYGWLIDDVSVIASPCELFNPSVQFTSMYPSGITFGSGPWPLAVTVTDANSGVDTTSVVLHYTIINGGVISSSAVPLDFAGGTIFNAQFTGSLPSVNEGDTICYYIYAADLCGNADSTVTYCAYIMSGISIPFIDNFDSGNPGWTDTTLSGSSWELGTPAYGLTTGAYSPPNAWDVSLNTGYLDNTQCMLYSPVFDFTGIANASLSFMHNYYMENSWDGVRIDFSTDGGLTWNVLGTAFDPAGVNWYNIASLNSSSLPGWTGITNGWTQSAYHLQAISNLPDVRFRYVFTSDAVINEDGYSLDNFMITLPADFDISLDSILVADEVPSGSVITAGFTFSNNGMLNINSFSFDVFINGLLDTTVVINTSLAAGASVTYYVPLVAPSDSMEICAAAILAGDTITTNNSLCSSPAVIQIALLPYSNDFESNTDGWTPQNIVGGTLWQWGTPSYGATSGAFSGTWCWDINLSGPYGHNASSFLYSPAFDLTGMSDSLRIGFAHNFRTYPARDGVIMEYDINSSGIWQKAGYLNDANGFNWYNDSTAVYPERSQFGGNSGGWMQSFFDLYIPSGNTVRFRFHFRSGVNSSYYEGYSMDDFYVTNKPSIDAAVVSATGISGNSGSASSPVVMIMNHGTSSISGFTVAYSINGIQIGSAVYSATLAPGQADTISLSSFNLPTGSYDFCTWVELAGDLTTLNDTLCTTGTGVVLSVLPFSDDFEGSNIWTVVTTGSSLTNWELGNPSFGLTTGTHSGLNCWDINLISAYSSNANTQLISPYFDLSNALNDTLKFWHNYDCETAWDGVRLEYELNASGNWMVLGTANDTIGINWYTDAQLNSSQLPAWEGTSAGWVQSAYPLAFLGTPSIVRFRFVFTSDISVQTTGYSIDDFEINNAFQNDIQVQSVTSPGLNAASGTPVNVNVNIYNAGIQAGIPFNIYYSLNGGAVNSQAVNTVIASGALLNVQLGAVVPVTGLYILRIYTDMSNDLNRFNDTLDYQFNGVLTVVPPYSQDFDVNADGWTAFPSSLGATSWELGMPSFGTTSSTHSGTVCWDINLLTPYGNGTFTSLESPVFNYSSLSQSVLRCWVNYSTEAGGDGVQLQYTLDEVNYTTLGVYNDVNATNWYNTANVPVYLGPAWTGNSSGWQQVTYNTSQLDGQPYVKFRFVFRSDITLSGDGFSMDDFELDGTVGISEVESENAIYIYPNPAGGNLYIRSSGAPREIAIFNATGQKMSCSVVSADSHLTSVDVSRLASGLYTIMVNSGGKTSIRRFIKE